MFSINSLSPFWFCYFVIFTAVFGLCVGSFLNVVILRGLSGESIVLPPSKCPRCNNRLKWYDNIPLFSYIRLRGRCRFCKGHISLQYPIVEALTSALFVILLLKFDFSFTTLFMWAMISMFIVLSVTDIKEQIIFTPHVYILAALGVLYNLAVNHDILFSVLGIVVGVVVMEILSRIGIFCIGSRAFGEGDSYIAGAIGAIIGWKMFLASVVIAVVFQTILIFPAFLYNLVKNRKYKILVLLALFTLNAIFLFQHQNLDFIIYILSVVILVILGLMTIVNIFSFLRETELQTIPFGPAMLIGAFVCIYFDKIVTVLIS